MSQRPDRELGKESRSASVRWRRARTRDALTLLLLACGSCVVPSYGPPSEDEGATPRSRSDGAVVARAGDAQSGQLQSDAAGAVDAAPGVTAPTDAARDETAPDAAAPVTDAELPDAGGPTTVALPSWAEPLLGQYAARTFEVKQDDYGTLSSSESVTLASFERGMQGVQLRTKICRSGATNSLAVAELRLVDPTNLPERIEQVVFSESSPQRWSTQGPTYTVGYSVALPSICEAQAGNHVIHTSAQVWLTSGTCRCPLPDEAPLVDDCRVLDQDHDQKPGQTYVLGGSSLYVAQASNSHYVNGQVAPDGLVHAANVMADEQAFQLGCDPAGCANIAVLGKFCPASFNRAQFVRLDPARAPAGGYSCADVVSQAASLFTDTPPSLTNRCYQ